MQYFYNNEWYSYEELHDLYGVTSDKPTLVTLYDLDVHEYHGWKFEDEFWSITDSVWYNPQQLPYYEKTQNLLNVYLIDQQLSLIEYTLRTLNLYEYNNHLYSFNFIHQHYGATLTPSSIYYVKDGNIKCWYNQDINKYWDVDTSRWYDNPPQYNEIIDVEDINEIGACGLFTYYNATGLPVSYGKTVSGSSLQPICLKFPASGEISCSVINTKPLTGTWRLLTAVTYSSVIEPCIVFAMKVSNEEINQSLSSDTSTQSVGNSVTVIEYNF